MNNQLRVLLAGKKHDHPGLNWPVRRTLRAFHAVKLPLMADGENWPTIMEYNRFMNPAVDSDNETLGCCSIENGSKPVEICYARDHDRYAPLRHAEIYKELLFHINGNDQDTGFELLTAMEGLKALGILKPDTSIEEIELNEAAISAAMQRGPLVWGNVPVGMMPNEINERGWADESRLGDTFALLNGGHCTCQFAQLRSQGYNVAVLRNAGWGGYGLNLHGILMLTTRMLLWTALCKPLLLTHTSGSIVGPDYERWVQA